MQMKLKELQWKEELMQANLKVTDSIKCVDGHMAGWPDVSAGCQIRRLEAALDHSKRESAKNAEAVTVRIPAYCQVLAFPCGILKRSVFRPVWMNLGTWYPDFEIPCVVARSMLSSQC
jgi:hypothetical protein